MAAATENTSRVEDVEGNRYVVTCNVTWDNANTFDTGYAGIEWSSFTPTTATAFGITKSNGTLTLVSGGALTGDLKVRSTGGG